MRLLSDIDIFENKTYDVSIIKEKPVIWRYNSPLQEKSLNHLKGIILLGKLAREDSKLHHT
jgi:hypothetical protein